MPKAYFMNYNNDLIEINNQTKSKIDLELVEDVVKNFLKHYKLKKQEVSIAFIGDQIITEINQKYRRINKTTDVLSFPGDNFFLGEILINYTQIKKQSKKFNNSVRQELIFILVHGLLHLIGYKDETDQQSKEMLNLGNEFVKLFYYASN